MKNKWLIFSFFLYGFSSFAFGNEGLDFNGKIYNDDRMFVLHVAKCTITDADDIADEIITIYHVEVPKDYKWCVITYRNIINYMPYRTDYFDTKKEANEFLERTEPSTPLISLKGRSYSPPPTYDEFVDWKLKNNFQEFNYKKVYKEGGTNPREIILKAKH